MSDLAEFAETLAAQRDRNIATALEAVTDGTREYHVGAAAAFRAALTYLHIYTGGEYGAREADQPNPFTRVPIGGASPSA